MSRWRAPARRTDGPHGRRAFPRRGRPGRSSSPTTSSGSRKPAPRFLRFCRMPSAVGQPTPPPRWASRRSGSRRPRRADHVGAGDLRAGRRPDRSRAGHRVLAPRRDGCLIARRRAGHLSCREPLSSSSRIATRRSRRAALQGRRRGSESCSAIRPAGHQCDSGNG